MTVYLVHDSMIVWADGARMCG